MGFAYVRKLSEWRVGKTHSVENGIRMVWYQFGPFAVGIWA
jgi:hypothetical protein